jgi:hypothetical protein
MLASDNGDQREVLLEAGEAQQAGEAHQANENGIGDGTKVSQEGRIDGESAASEDKEAAYAIREELDVHDTRAFEQSLWDALIFLWMPHVGNWVSLLTAICVLLNFILQTSFLYIVYFYMLDGALGEGDLNDLLHFRASTSHSFMRADPLSHESMAHLICQYDGSEKATMASDQSQLQQSGFKFSHNSAGTALAVVVQICWLGSVMKDLVGLRSLIACLLKIRGKNTQLQRTSQGDEFSVTLKSISLTRFIGVMVTVVLPRLFIAVSLGYVGVQYLAKTEDMSDLVLNALALTFVFDLDELLFAILAPRRLHVLIDRVEPLQQQRIPAGMETALVLTGITVAVSVTYIFLIQPFAWNLGMAHHIVCGGNQDFVYVHNRATGMIHVVESNIADGSREWSRDELTILNEVGLKLEEWSPKDHNWNDIDDRILELSQHNKSAMREVREGRDAFRVMSDYQSQSVADISRLQTCEDLTSDDEAQSGEARAYLAITFSLDTYVCGEPLGNISFEDACSQHGMTILRASCPAACGCGSPWMPRHLVAAFDSIHFGCPLACESKFDSRRQQIANDYKDYGEGIRQYVSNMPDVYSLTFQASDGMDLVMYKWIMKYIEGVKEFFLQKPEHARVQRSQGSVARLLDLNVGDENLKTYNVSTLCGSTGSINGYSHPCSEGMVEATDFANYVANGSLLTTILHGQWQFHPSVPHPRGLTGCAFFTSWELRSLLGLDLCSTDDVLSSIRPICAEECGCKLGMSQCYSLPSELE